MFIQRATRGGSGDKTRLSLPSEAFGTPIIVAFLACLRKIFCVSNLSWPPSSEAVCLLNDPCWGGLATVFERFRLACERPYVSSSMLNRFIDCRNCLLCVCSSFSNLSTERFFGRAKRSEFIRW